MKLKPCPFCSAKAELLQDEDEIGPFFTLGCSDEHCIAYWAYYTEDEIPIDRAIDVWNTRSEERR